MKKTYFISEQLKFIYNRWIILTILGLGLFIPAMTIVLNTAPEKISFDFLANQILQSFYLGQVGFVVITALYFGQELSHATLRTSLLCLPNRGKFLLTKLLSLLMWEIILLAVFTIFSIIVISFNFRYNMNQEELLKMFTLLISVYLSTIQLSFIQAALVMIGGLMVVALVAVLSFILGLGQVLLQFYHGFRYFPVLSVMNAFSTRAKSVYPQVAAGLCFQQLWCILLLVTAFFILRRRTVR